MAAEIKRYELSPVDGRKSFYGKAMVLVFLDGSEALSSYDRLIIVREADGTLVRVADKWEGPDGKMTDWSATTGRHIKAFCGIDKKTYLAMPVDELWPFKV